MNAKAEINEAVQVAHKSVYSALVSAQANMTKALKDVPNGAFKTKYADLANVQDACFPALNAEGIAVIQPTGEDEAGRFVETVFYHADTDTQIKCRVPLIVGRNDMQGYGSAVTYARRYGLMSLAGIAPEDDDGNAAAAAAPKPISAAAMKRGLEEIDKDLTDCTSLYEVNKCAKVWAEIMERDNWSAEYRDFAKPKFAKRRNDLDAQTNEPGEAA
jgi:hypothetical protein